MLAEKQIIEKAFEAKDFTSNNEELLNSVRAVYQALDKGNIRIAEKINNDWVINQWIKKAILISFRLFQNEVIDGKFTKYFDKIPLKYSDYNKDLFLTDKARIVPPAIAREGCYIAPNSVIMPSYINIGAYIDSGSLIDTWATVGSCAQIGKNVHLSGGAGIGGVLEPLQANPTIIEDNCFIGARSEIVEGVIVREGAVIGMGVFIGQSTKIYNRATGEIIYGEVPPYSVVVPGSLPSKDGSHSLACAVIVKQVDEKTRSKTSINELLRD